MSRKFVSFHAEIADKTNFTDRPIGGVFSKNTKKRKKAHLMVDFLMRMLYNKYVWPFHGGGAGNEHRIAKSEYVEADLRRPF